MIATLFGEGQQIGRLYFADLLGAGLACAVVVLPDRHHRPSGDDHAGRAGHGPHRAVGRPAAAGRGRAGRSRAHRRPGRARGGPRDPPRPHPDRSKGELVDTISHEWSPIFRVDVDDFEDTLLLFHDGLLGSVITKWDGERASLASSGSTPTPSVPLPSARPAAGERDDHRRRRGPRDPGLAVLPGQGHRRHRAQPRDPRPGDRQVRRLRRQPGRPPGVNYVTDDGRSFLARSDEDLRPDLVPGSRQLLGHQRVQRRRLRPFRRATCIRARRSSSLEHLSDDGILAAQFGEANFDKKTNRTTR